MLQACGSWGCDPKETDSAARCLELLRHFSSSIAARSGHPHGASELAFLPSQAGVVLSDQEIEVSGAQSCRRCGISLFVCAGEASSHPGAVSNDQGF